jgi:ectoine hydroxylase-related dioxygenase (phytanoyl-CoA dioxygenase family)
MIIIYKTKQKVLKQFKFIFAILDVFKLYFKFSIKKENTIEDYQKFRTYFIKTNGLSNNLLSNYISIKNGIYKDIQKKGIFENLSYQELEKCVESIRTNGFHVFENKLNKKDIESIRNYALTTTARYVITENSKVNEGKWYSDEKVHFNPNNVISPRYQFDNNDILNNSTIQNLIFDQTLLDIAQRYLKTKPILDLFAFWWSAPFDGKSKSEAAQMYHFDMDRIKFIKFFFYLTDVNTNTGPHCYVRGSHKKLPNQLRKDGRFEDSLINSLYSKEDILELCGFEGTIMAVDTRGIHKGKELIEGNRLLFQIEFANSYFGQMYPKVDSSKLYTNNKELVKKYPLTYNQIFN